MYINIKKVISFFSIFLLCSVFMFFVGVVCRNAVSKINYLENEILRGHSLQKELNEFYYLNSWDTICLEDKCWGENTLKKPHVFFVISDLNCSMCLDDFMRQLIVWQDSMDIRRVSILLINTSREILHRYKRIYKIKMPMYVVNIDKLSLIMNKFNVPYAFISDQSFHILHLYSSKDVSFLQYMKLMKRRYF